MRRLAAVLLMPALLSLLLLLSATAVSAAPGSAPAGEVLVLAVEEGGEGEPAGREPPGPNDPGNPNPPAEYEQNFLWGAAVGLTALAVGGVALLAGLYYLLVLRPQREESVGT